MSVMKVEKQQPLVKPENVVRELCSPMFPVGRFFGMNPLEIMRQFTEEMDRLFFGKTHFSETWVRPIHVRRSNGNLVITADVPAMKKEDVKVEVINDELIIEGERKSKHKKEKETHHRYEHSFGKFYRSISLPETAKLDEIKAELKDGILRIWVPAPEPKPHRIPVEESSGKTVA